MLRTFSGKVDPLLNITEKVFEQSSVVIKNGTNGYNWNIPVDELRLGYDWYLEKYDILWSAPPVLSL